MHDKHLPLCVLTPVRPTCRYRSATRELSSHIHTLVPASCCFTPSAEAHTCGVGVICDPFSFVLLLKTKYSRKGTSEQQPHRTKQARNLKSSAVTQLAQQHHHGPRGPVLVASSCCNLLATSSQHFLHCSTLITVWRNTLPRPRTKTQCPLHKIAHVFMDRAHGLGLVQQAVVRCARIISGVHTGVNV